MSYIQQSPLAESIIFNDIDISRLDLRHRQDIAQLIMDKDQLILENSERHRSILKDYELVLDAFTIKDLELSRTNQSYNDMLEKIDQYKMKA